MTTKKITQNKKFTIKTKQNWNLKKDIMIKSKQYLN